MLRDHCTREQKEECKTEEGVECCVTIFSETETFHPAGKLFKAEGKQVKLYSILSETDRIQVPPPHTSKQYRKWRVILSHGSQAVKMLSEQLSRRSRNHLEAV